MPTTTPEIASYPSGELKFWLAVTRRLPRIRGCGKLCGLVSRIYNRKRRPDVTATVFDAKMVLEPSDCVEGQFLFCPHLYDRREIACLRKALKPGDTFLDAGANVGFYSLIASRIVGATGAVIAVEADPFNASRMAKNLEMSQIHNVRLVNAGLSDRTETLRLGRDAGGNRGGHSFLYNSPEAVEVQCRTLVDILSEQSVSKVAGAKFDIEGFEFKVLQRFFQDAVPDLWPKFFIIEYTGFYAGKSGGDIRQLLVERGYDLVLIGETNYFAVRKSSLENNV